MVRTARTLSVGVALAAMAVLGSGAAQAATGSLGINENMQGNPHGCYAVEGDPAAPNTIANYTDREAVTFNSPDCTGASAGTIPAGAIGVAPATGSILID
ncbi:hypothetical protein [Nocardia vermiculata]|uniref:Secreted protein n=1 Tax=Nocardia vermiculata TaxID=257274 RepID=A0A846Y1F4_9NOCA|nr:hypothetical protein [Nocardia vermiculata]NKY51511.1 hypothetical protein [Nocardia vermiculata]